MRTAKISYVKTLKDGTYVYHVYFILGDKTVQSWPYRQDDLALAVKMWLVDAVHP